MKGKFCSELEEFNTIPANEKAIIGGDLNGPDHRGVEIWHGGWGYGEKNAEGHTRIYDSTGHGTDQYIL
jgi:hypothetical protein